MTLCDISLWKHHGMETFYTLLVLCLFGFCCCCCCCLFVRLFVFFVLFFLGVHRSLEDSPQKRVIRSAFLDIGSKAVEQKVELSLLSDAITLLWPVLHPCPKPSMILMYLTLLSQWSCKILYQDFLGGLMPSLSCSLGLHKMSSGMSFKGSKALRSRYFSALVPGQRSSAGVLR